MKRRLVAVLLGLVLNAAPLGPCTLDAAPFHAYPLAVSAQVASAYTTQDIRTAYNVGPLYARHIDGKGQTVAIIATDRLALPALTAFDRANSLPPPTLRERFAGNPTLPFPEGGEADLDVEWLHALAPGAAIEIDYIDAGSDVTLWSRVADAIGSIRRRGIKTISISLNTCPALPGLHRVAAALAAARSAGVSIFVASGDNGSTVGQPGQCHDTSVTGVDYPAGDPSVVSVGGTTLRLSKHHTIARETAWRLSGGGRYIDPSGGLLRPTWQVAPTLPRDAYRYAPDVAFDADGNTGVSAAANGHWIETGGTSLGAPAWAAIWALVRQDAGRAHLSLGTAPNVIYRIGNSSRYRRAFHDITAGSNGKYAAGLGWDAVTGWGSPDVDRLAGAALALSHR